MKARSREARVLIWRAVRNRETFTLPGLAKGVGLPYRTVQRYVRLLQDHGYVERLEDYEPREQNQGVYRLRRDTGLYPPQVVAGQLVDPNQNPDQVTAQARAWQVCRKLRILDTYGLASLSGMTPKATQKYLKSLRDGNYLRLEQENQSGKGGSMNVYRLVRDTGPYPLMVRRDGSVFDPNLQPLRGA